MSEFGAESAAAKAAERLGPEAARLIDETWRLGLACRDAGRANDARDLFQSILDVIPYHAGALQQLGGLSWQAGDAAAALDYLERARQAEPGQGQRWLDVAQVLLHLRRADEALSLLHTAVTAGLPLELAQPLLRAGQEQITARDREREEQSLWLLLSGKGPKHAPTKSQGKPPTSKPAVTPLAWREAQARQDWLELAMMTRKHLERAAADSRDRATGPAWHLLGLSLLQTHRTTLAAACLERAVLHAPGNAEIRLHLALALQGTGDAQKAAAAFADCLALRPDYPEAWLNQGVGQLNRGEWDAACASLERAAALAPDWALPPLNLALARRETGDAAAALSHGRRALALAPDLPEAHHNLAGCLTDVGRFEQAVHHFRQAQALKPDWLPALLGLGSALVSLGRHEDALTTLDRALALDGASPRAHFLRALALKKLGRLEETVAALETVLRLTPHDALARCALGDAERDRRRLPQALAHYRQTLAETPDFHRAHAHLLFALCHDQTAPPEAVAAAHRAFGARIEAPWREHWPDHGALLQPQPVLNLGFVSADLARHAVATFVQPLWAALDRRRFRLVAYSNRVEEDDISEALKQLAHLWRPVAQLSDDALAQQIQQDEIHVLFDLSGHTNGHRLPVFARKPAPVQISWIGYPNTTGLTAMDYYIADRFEAPPGLLDPFFTEKIIRLPATSCFQPSDVAPQVTPLPALTRGRLTFGSFNRASKLSEASLDLWSAVLRALPQARLILAGVCDGAVEAATRQDISARFAARGVAAERLEFAPRGDMADYLSRHGAVDLILDTLPYNGGTTSFHAAWMGAPVLTLAGQTLPGREGVSINSHLGLTEFIAETPEQFVALAVAWSRRLPELAALRADLRQRMADSRLGRPDLLARSLEQALLTLWQRRIAGLSAESFEVVP